MPNVLSDELSFFRHVLVHQNKMQDYLSLQKHYQSLHYIMSSNKIK